jgi:hypothetical protein
MSSSYAYLIKSSSVQASLENEQKSNLDCVPYFRTCLYPCSCLTRHAHELCQPISDSRILRAAAYIVTGSFSPKTF